MASTSDKDDQYVNGDQQQRSLSYTKDEHYNLIDEKGDHVLPITNICDVTTISKESEYNAVSSSKSVIQSSYTLSTLIKNNHNDNSDKGLNNTEFLFNNEVIDTENSEFNVHSNTKNKEDNSDITIQSPKIREYDPTIDERLPETVTLLTTPDGGKLYLVGTAHFSIESQNDVSKIIQAVQPEVVVIELCKARVGILKLDEELLFRYAKNIDYQCIKDTIKTEGVYNGLLYISLLKMAAYLAKELGMPPGGEFRRAFEEAKKVPNCIVYMADRPINITMQRAIRSLSWWQTIKLIWYLSTMNEPITQEDVELCKQRAMLDYMIATMKKEFPVLGEVFVKERDIYLTYSLQLACRPQLTVDGLKPARIVGIVGLGHMSGIIQNWGKIKPSDIPPIMSIPSPSLSSKIMKLTVKASVLGIAIYVGYKVVKIPVATSALESIKSSVKGLLNISVPW